jgi:hypothetical protein
VQNARIRYSASFPLTDGAQTFRVAALSGSVKKGDQ